MGRLSLIDWDIWSGDTFSDIGTIILIVAVLGVVAGVVLQVGWRIETRCTRQKKETDD